MPQCEGWRRYGGVFTFGPTRWEQCKESATVTLKFKDPRTKEVKTLPACPKCWQECIDTKIEILEAKPVSAKKGKSNESKNRKVGRSPRAAR